MLLILSLIGALIWATFIYILLRIRTSPEALLRKRINDMIDQAEEQRIRESYQRNLPAPIPGMPIDIPQIIGERETFYKRAIRPMLNNIEEFFQRFAPNAIRSRLEEKIFHAGKTGTWNVQRLVTVWCMSIGLIVFVAILWIQRMQINTAQEILFIILAILIGAVVPFVVLNSKIRQRQKDIRNQLPEFLDILCVSVQAGLSFDGAIAKMTKRMKGPLIDEFIRMQNDVSLGMTHQYALTALARRCDLEEVYLFTNSIIQAEKLGTSMARTLKVQADNMRDRHRQWIKAEALRAPVKILFPMIIFIFPSMFIVLLFPALFNLAQNIGNK